MSTTTKVQIDTKTFIRFWLVIIGFAFAGYLLYKASFGLSIIFAALFFALAISPLIKIFSQVKAVTFLSLYLIFSSSASS